MAVVGGDDYTRQKVLDDPAVNMAFDDRAVGVMISFLRRWAACIHVIGGIVHCRCAAGGHPEMCVYFTNHVPVYVFFPLATYNLPTWLMLWCWHVVHPAALPA